MVKKKNERIQASLLLEFIQTKQRTIVWTLNFWTGFFVGSLAQLASEWRKLLRNHTEPSPAVEPGSRCFRWLSPGLLKALWVSEEGGWDADSGHPSWSSALTASPGRLEIYRRNRDLQSVAINRWLSEVSCPSRREGGGPYFNKGSTYLEREERFTAGML